MNPNLKMIAILAGISAIPPISTDIYVPAFPLISSTFNVSAAQVQLSLTSNLLGLACGQIFFGPVSDVYGRRRPLLLSLAAFIIASLACAMVNDINSLIALRFLQGLAGSGGVVLSRAVTFDKYKGQSLTEIVALLLVINGIAPIAAPVIGGQLTAHLGWRSIFEVLGMCGFGLWFFTWRGLAESLPPEQRTSSSIGSILRSFMVLFQNKIYLAYLAIHCLMMGGLFAYIAASPFILQNIYGLSPVGFSICFAVNGFGMMISTKLAAGLIMRVGEHTQLKIVTAVFVAAGLAITLAHTLGALSLPLLLGLLFIAACCIGISECNSFSLAMQAITANAGSASGLLGIGSFLLGALMTPLVNLGSSFIISLGIILIVTGGISLITLVRTPQRS